MNMEFLHKVKLIQGGMGVYVSNWRMAKAVAMEKPDITAGTVSGTGLDWVYVRLLQLGDPGGHVQRALAAFDAKFDINIGRKIYERYFITGGKASATRFKNPPQQIVRALDGSDIIPFPVQPVLPVALTLDKDIIELLIATGFAEVWLAKEGHDGNIFINFLKKVELPLVYTMYGAMLADVDGVIVGAGNPDGLPAIRSRLVNHEAVNIDLSVLYREPGEVFYVSFDPKLIADGKLAQKPLRKPAFLAIASLENLVKILAQSQSEAPDGFVIEHHTAGGHNAGPQGPVQLDGIGQPIYSELDEPDLHEISQVGLPFWLAGGYDCREKLQQALDAGAVGVQIGTVFALTEESGIKSPYRAAILNAIKKGTDESALVRTTLFSPTGFPFKVAQLNETLAIDTVYSTRRRVCDIGLLQQRGLSKPAADGTRQLFQRCPAAPVEGFINKRGLPHNTEGRRCLCNGLLACVGLGQVDKQAGEMLEESAIVTLGNHLDGIRRLSRQGQTPYWVRDVVNDILGD
jgi:NAD(P)H-dependent flavin oxidoreductase YrpB (nitropropane dioxygenase family)